MIIPKSLFGVSNPQAEDYKIKGVLDDINSTLIKSFNNKNKNERPLMVCSGGTSSRCASEGNWTLDLRKKFNNIYFNNVNQEVIIDGGVIIKDMLDLIKTKKRTFPSGLSNLTGVGYILTGGISPLSRVKGLAVDQILEINGFWGNGKEFSLKKPEKSSSSEKFIQWRGLCGAAPFLAIVTNIRLKTFQLNPIYKCEVYLEPNELPFLIKESEYWPNFASLSWFWGESIKAYVIIEIPSKEDIKEINDILMKLSKFRGYKVSKVSGIHALGKIEVPNESISTTRKYSEVLSLLGASFNDNAKGLTQSLEKLMSSRPFKGCYIAAQQLGGATTQIDPDCTSFIYRDAIWKPWITGEWPKGDEKTKAKSISWMKEVWEIFKPLCPGIHLAQLHPHLNWHDEEIQAAYKDWLPILKKLKSSCDPKGILPPL